MFVITVKFVTNDQHAEKFKNRVLKQAQDSLKFEEQCHVFDVCHDPNDMNVVFLYEVYTDKNAFEAHLNSDHYLGFNEEVTPWIIEKQVNQLIKQKL